MRWHGQMGGGSLGQGYGTKAAGILVANCVSDPFRAYGCCKLDFRISSYSHAYI